MDPRHQLRAQHHQGHTATEIPTILTRPVRGTVGAGDALLAAVVDGLLRHYQPTDALRRAVIFASHAISEPGGAAGLPTAQELTTLCAHRLRARQHRHLAATVALPVPCDPCQLPSWAWHREGWIPIQETDVLFVKKRPH